MDKIVSKLLGHSSLRRAWKALTGRMQHILIVCILFILDRRVVVVVDVLFVLFNLLIQRTRINDVVTIVI